MGDHGRGRATWAEIDALKLQVARLKQDVASAGIILHAKEEFIAVLRETVLEWAKFDSVDALGAEVNDPDCRQRADLLRESARRMTEGVLG